MRMGVMLGEPGVAHAQFVGQADEFGDFGEDFSAGPIGWAFEMIGQPYGDRLITMRHLPPWPFLRMWSG